MAIVFYTKAIVSQGKSGFWTFLKILAQGFALR